MIPLPVIGVEDTDPILKDGRRDSMAVSDTLSAQLAFVILYV